MASPYKMKNSMLRMAVKGAPIQKNYGSPMHDKDDKNPNPPVYTSQDSTRAYNTRKAELNNTTYKPTTKEVDFGTNYKKLLKETDANTKESGNYNTVKGDALQKLKKKKKPTTTKFDDNYKF